MKKLVALLMAGVVCVSTIGCSKPTQEVEVSFLVTDKSYSNANEYVDYLNSSNTEGIEYSVYENDDMYYSKTITEKARQECLETVDKNHLEKSFDNLLESDYTSGALTSAEVKDDKMQEVVFYADSSIYAKEGVEDVVNELTAMFYLNISDMYQAYNLVKPEDRVYTFTIVDKDSNDVLYEYDYSKESTEE